MSTQSHLVFLQKITRKMADTFQELHQLCLQEINSFNNVEAPPTQLQPPQTEPVPEVEDLVVEAESPQEEASVRSAGKTKRIKKDVVGEGEEQRESESKGRKKTKKVSHKPKAPSSSFLLFFKDQQGSIAQAYPTYGVTELTKVAAKLWSEYSSAQKAPYVKLCDEERRVYQQKMQKYREEFPQEIAEKEKDRLSRRKLKTGKQPSRKDKQKDKAKVESESKPQAPSKQPQKMIVEEESQSEIDPNEEDSLGIM